MAKTSCPRLKVKDLVASSSLADKAAELGESAKTAALTVTELVAAKAMPKAQAALEWAAPRVEEAWSKSVAAAAPRIEDAAKALAPKVDEARDLIVDRALPAIVAAVDSAARAATGAQIELARKASRRRRRRIIGWSLVAATGTAVAYWFWRQTRPITDPWAEEDWEDLETAPEEDLSDAAGDAADALGEAAGVAVKAVTDAAKKSVGAVKKASGAARKAVSEAVHPDREDAAEPDEAKTDAKTDAKAED
ncbi:MAG: hypothetical protein LBD90_02515 [Bifidobacteriaceae bacterium]|jgi:uncharacterized protein YjbJ (UPF0337 family)|nr:hypothetical protein [Bifidobacteriaceae bacterium]